MILLGELMITSDLVDALRDANHVTLEIKDRLAHDAHCAVPRAGVNILVEARVLQKKNKTINQLFCMEEVIYGTELRHYHFMFYQKRNK